jgi:hypothetical protein
MLHALVDAVASHSSHALGALDQPLGTIRGAL